MSGAMFRTSGERSIKYVPVGILIAFVMALTAEMLWVSVRQPPQAYVEQLPEAQAIPFLKLSGMGDDIFLSKALMLWLQSYDYQPGISLSYSEIDYQNLISWLDVILDLDPRSQYPLLLASRVYGDVNDTRKQLMMIQFIEDRFSEYPDRRWRWMAHAVYIAKYRLKDMDLALELAGKLAEQTSADKVPFWAQQMHIYILEDMGQLRAAKILLGGLIESGEVDDPNELRFLKKRLNMLQEQITNKN